MPERTITALIDDEECDISIYVDNKKFGQFDDFTLLDFFIDNAQLFKDVDVEWSYAFVEEGDFPKTINRDDLTIITDISTPPNWKIDSISYADDDFDTALYVDKGHWDECEHDTCTKMMFEFFVKYNWTFNCGVKVNEIGAYLDGGRPSNEDDLIIP